VSVGLGYATVEPFRWPGARWSTILAWERGTAAYVAAPKERLLPFPDCGISAEHVIVGQEVLVAEVLRGLRVGLYCFRVGTFLAVWKRYPYVHNRLPFTR
jgi:hypothetical protein